MQRIWWKGKKMQSLEKSETLLVRKLRRVIVKLKRRMTLKMKKRRQERSLREILFGHHLVGGSILQKLSL